MGSETNDGNKEVKFYMARKRKITNQALATFTTYARYPALDCLSQNFVQCGQAMKD